MANSNWNKKDSARTSASREESGGMHGSPSGSEKQGDGFDTGNARQGGKSGAGTGGSDRGQQGDSSGGFSGSGSGHEGGNKNAAGAGQQTGNRNSSSDSGLDDSRDRGMSGSSGTSGSTGLGGETSEGSTSRPGGVEGTSERDGREDPDRGSRR